MKTSIWVMVATMAVLSVNADTLVWNNTIGDYGTASNWDPSQMPVAADELRVNNGGTTTVTVGNSYAGGKLKLGYGAGNSGQLSMSGGMLTLTGKPSLSVADGSSSTSTVTLAGSSVLNASGNVQVGTRGLGSLDIGPSAAGSSAILYIGAASGGDGTVDLDGTWSASKVLVVNNAAAKGVLNLNGGSLTVSGDFDMDFAGLGSGLTVTGSAGSFSAGGNLLAASSAATLGFVADAGGFTTLNIDGLVNIAGATLNIDLDAYAGPTNTPLVLMSGASVSGSFSAVNWLGSESAYVAYSITNVTLMWTDPGEAPRLPATMEWVGSTGAFADSNNWDLVYVPMSDDTLSINNGGTATIVSGTNTATEIILGETAYEAGNLLMSGGILTSDTMPIALGSSSAGSVTLTGSSSLICSSALNIGMRGSATVDIGSSASVSTPLLRIGGFGPDSSAIVIGSAIVNLSGLLVSGTVQMPQAGADGQLNLNGGSLTCDDFYMDWLAENYITNRSSVLSVNGSSGSFYVTNNFTLAATNATLNLVADMGGVTTLTAGGNVDVEGATLNVDLSGLPSLINLVLIDGNSLSGTFGDVNISGGNMNVVYDTDNGDVLLVPSISGFEIMSLNLENVGGNNLVSVVFDTGAGGSLWFTPDLVFPSWTNVASGMSPIAYTNAAPVGFYKVTTP